MASRSEYHEVFYIEMGDNHLVSSDILESDSNTTTSLVLFHHEQSSGPPI